MSGGQSIVSFSNGWRFETLEHRQLDALMGPAADDWLMHIERPTMRLAYVVAGVFVAAYLVWRFGIALLVAGAIALTPEPAVQLIDQSNLALLDRSIAQPSTLPVDLKANVQAIFDDVVRSAPKPDFGDYTLHFRYMDGLGANALALPGGAIIITDELVQNFVDPNIIAGVLSHETVHVEQNHALKQLYRSLSVFVLVALILGDVGPILEELVFEGGILLSLANSREQELEADLLGMQIAEKAGYDPAGLIEFFEIMEKIYGADDRANWWSTHPHSHERANLLRDALDEF
ncbi:M48 family metallopeptidase [Actibacterium mucosum]|uniref:M48 family metallopeptidase n=1 Tax=Actibacterium mucosum TaxID=1087332 RepID=UPI001269336D|nr:M48 family metallopeptidase [Actibacterium mucosum]